MPLIATQIDQTGADFDVSGPVVSALEDETGHRYLVIRVWTPWGAQDVLLDMDECVIERKRLN